MEIKDIKKWFEIAIPEPTTEQACIQIGCHYEEVAEMAEALGDDEAQHSLEVTAYDYKSVIDWCYDTAEGCRKVELLDSLCDQIVTAIGVAHMLGMDIEGALAEVNASNHSKFEDGKAVFDENGEIKKGVHYRGPVLGKFIGGE